MRGKESRWAAKVTPQLNNARHPDENRMDFICRFCIVTCETIRALSLPPAHQYSACPYDMYSHKRSKSSGTQTHVAVFDAKSGKKLS